MANPSLLIIPDRYKAAKLYSQIPDSGAGDFTVTRGTTATRVNASGLIESVASGVPRIDYTGGGCGKLLVEPAATNLALYSEEFDDAYWTKTNATISANVAVSPDGASTAEKLIADTTVGQHRVTRNISVTAGSAFTFSAYVKKSEYDFVRVIQGGSGGAGLSARTSIVNLTNGNIISETVSGQTKVIDANNGWYRISVTSSAATGSGAPTFIVESLNNSAGTDFAGNNSDGIFIWGAQLETGSVATSYIPTVASTVTRNADVISLSSASALIGQTEGTLYAEVDFSNLQVNNVRVLTIRESANSNNFFQIERQSSTALRITARLNSGSTINFLTHANAPVAGANKIAFAYANGNYALGLNGVVTTSAQAGMTASLNQVLLGQDGFASASTFLNDRISAAALYASRLSNSELASLTQL